MRRLSVLLVSLFVLASVAQAAKTLPFPPPPPADLTFSAYAVTSPAVVHCGAQTIIFNVTETNLGAGPAAPYLTYHFSNGVAFCARSRPALAAGASASFTDICSLNNGPCECSATYTIPFFGLVDSLNAVAETNEANNQSQTVIQPAQCP